MSHSELTLPFCADVNAILFTSGHQIQLEALNFRGQLLDHGGLADALVELQCEIGHTAMQEFAFVRKC